MAELILEPYVVVQHWQLPDAEGHWEYFGEYLQIIAQRCTTVGECVIGHIKALSIFPDKSYLRISVVAMNIPASVEGKVPATALTLNSI